MAKIVGKNTGDLPGTIKAWGNVSSPNGYLVCDGRSLSQTQYAALYQKIGTSFGDGTTGTVFGTPGGSRFNLPDLRGRFLRGVDASAGNDPDTGARTAMAAGGNTGNNVGSIQADAFKLHKHGIRLSHETGGGHDSHGFPQVDMSGPMVTHSENQADASESTSSGSGNPLVSSGGNESRPKNAYVNYIIKY